ncbi:MAG: hypothetical protein SH818_09455 [Saprospiraceae bacterium]|nr:hypothetical protein [Saprospiraceae bacterium]
MKRIIFPFFLLAKVYDLPAQVALDSILPIRGITLSAPSPAAI